MTRAPIATANCVADNPTGPCPKIAIVPRPERPTRRNAPYAVPVPHEIAAPVSNDRPSGSGTNVLAGTFMYRACPPLPVTPYTVEPSTHIASTLFGNARTVRNR